MNATYYVGDVFDVLATLEPDSVDLVFSSPPFLALRSYLPADHPDKGKEIGSEATPADFLDTLLDVVEACDRVLAPHGSLCFELGDTFAGSSGAGGDYTDGGWRDGQGTFNGSASRGASRESCWSYPDVQWLAALLDAEGSIAVQVDRRDEKPRYTPIVQIGMNQRTMLDRVLAITGVGAVTESSGQPRWQAIGQQARYVLANIWQHLMVKQDRAKAAIELARHVEDRACGRGNPVTSEDLAYRETIRRYIMNLNEKGGNNGRFPNDWTPPTPRLIQHPLIGGPAWPMDKSLAGIPTLFAWSLAYGRNLLRPERETPRWRIRNLVVWARPNPPVGALGDKFRPATSYVTVATKARGRYFDLDAVREPHQTEDALTRARAIYDNEQRGPGGDQTSGNGTTSNPAGAPPLDYWVIPTAPYQGSHYATFPPDLVVKPVKSMCPQRVCRVCGEPSRRIVEQADEEYTVAMAEKQRQRDLDSEHGLTGVTKNNTAMSLISNGVVKPRYETLGWTDCGHNDWRPGMCLDPFAGSGTVLSVATGHGRDAIGIDLDARNAELALERVGPLMLTVETLDGEGGDYGDDGLPVNNPKFRPGYVRNDRPNRPPQASPKAYGSEGVA